MGRPRKSGSRTKSGRLARRVDRGQVRLREKRAWLANSEFGGDPVKTVYPLGVMFTNGVIGDAEHNSGCRYAWLHALIYGRVSIAGARYDEQIGRDGFEPDDIWIQARKVELRKADESFSRRRERDEVINLVVYERSPRWLLPCVPTPSDIVQAEVTIEALGKLAGALGGFYKRSA